MIYKIKDFGAEERIKINTKAIQKAIDTCNEKGGGRVVCGPGIFKTGTIILKSNVNLFLEKGSILVGSEELKDYKDLIADGFIPGEMHEKSKNALILAAFEENISITGMGEINGSGLAFYDHKTADSKGKFAKPDNQRPRIVMFYRCKNILIEDVSFVNSSCWTIWLMQCENVLIKKIRVLGDRRMRNVDGIDIDGCKNVVVSDCIMNTEDDCIAIRSIKNLYQQPCVCENITVNNCIFRTSCNGIRIGCPADGEIKNCVFNNIIIETIVNGILLEYPKRYLPHDLQGSANVHDIMFNNFLINAQGSPIALIIEDGVKILNLSDIVFSNIKIVNSKKPILISGNKQSIICSIKFENIGLKTKGEDAILCRWARGIKFNNFEVSYDYGFTIKE